MSNWRINKGRGKKIAGRCRPNQRNCWFPIKKWIVGRCVCTFENLEEALVCRRVASSIFGQTHVGSGPYILRGPKYVVSSPTPTMFSFGGVEHEQGKGLLFGYHDMFCFNGAGGGGGKASEDDLTPGCQGAYPLCALACLVVSESKEQSVPTLGEGMGVGERT